MLRIGIGYDLHKLIKGRKLFIGGIEIPFYKGAISHSDGDVLLHAISDSMLGACGFGDIGKHFPDTDPKYRDIYSVEILKMTLKIINSEKKISIVNIDTVVICDEPKIMGYADKMETVIASTIGISSDCVNIKAKTTENTRNNVISAYAVCLVDIK